MTNFEYMKQKVLDMVSALDEAALKQLTIYTCMDESGAEGIFNCALCEEIYGGCDTLPEGNECMKKYLKWCTQEHKDGADPKGNGRIQE